MDTCSIVITSYGDEKWMQLAIDRAFPSALWQGGHEIVLRHYPDGTAASARNQAVAESSGKWIVMLDADDELEPGYVDAMLAGAGDLRYPLVRYINSDYIPGITPFPAPRQLTRRHLLLGNYMVIGTMVEKRHFLAVGGLREFKTWEDWFLWMQLTYLGAVPVLIPQAVYRIYQHSNSRVTVPDPAKVFLEMKDQFRQWALKFNGGLTYDLDYRRFIAQGNPRDQIK